MGYSHQLTNLAESPAEKQRSGLWESLSAHGAPFSRSLCYAFMFTAGVSFKNSVFFQARRSMEQSRDISGPPELVVWLGGLGCEGTPLPFGAKCA